MLRHRILQKIFLLIQFVMSDSFDDLKINYVEKISIREWWIQVGIIAAICSVAPIILIFWHFKRTCQNSSTSDENESEKDQIIGK